MANLSFIIDPGGVPDGRPGINLQVFPDGNEPIKWPTQGPLAERLANQSLSGGGFNEVLEFSWSATLSSTNYAKLRQLINWMQLAKSRLEQWEVVIYNLAEKYHELSPTQTRMSVPSTAVESTLVETGWYQFSYWVALQGNLNITPRQVGSLYQVEFNFVEGTKLLNES